MSNNWNDPNAPLGENSWQNNDPSQAGQGWDQNQQQPQQGSADGWDAMNQQQPQTNTWDQTQQPAANNWDQPAAQPQANAWDQPQQPQSQTSAWDQPQAGYPAQGGYPAAGPGYPAAGAGYPAAGYGGPGIAQGMGPGGRPLASWGKRALGALIDIVLPMFIIGIIWFFLFDTETASTGDGSLSVSSRNNFSNLISWGILALILPALAGKTGQTPGRKLAKTQLVDENGIPLSYGKSALRTLLHVIDNYICCIGFLFPLWDKQRQTLADKIVKSYVIDVEQGGPINVQQ